MIVNQIRLFTTTKHSEVTLLLSDDELHCSRTQMSCVCILVVINLGSTYFSLFSNNNHWPHKINKKRPILLISDGLKPFWTKYLIFFNESILESCVTRICTFWLVTKHAKQLKVLWSFSWRGNHSQVAFLDRKMQ